MHAYYGGWFSFEDANWIAALFGGAYNVAYSWTNEEDTEDPLEILDQTMDFWFLILYTLVGGVSY